MKYTVIIAEDEELLLNNLVEKIPRSDSEFEVVGTAQTGDQALELVKKERPDLIMTDIKMPVMDGMTLLTEVHNLFPLTKMVIISGFSDFEYARQAIALKVTDYLLKPVMTEDLTKVLQKVKNEIQIAGNHQEETYPSGTSHETPAQIASFLKDYLVENHTRDVNLNLIAEKLNYSSSHLSKIFSQIYGCTPNKYLMNLRMSHAQSLLLHNPELSIREIGEMVGYHDQGYFSRIFKKQVGKSPFDYRGSE